MWGETINKDILLRLRFNNCRKININAYDEYNNSIFYLKLFNFNTKKLICMCNRL